MATLERTPDAELLHRLRERDRAAWEELYAVHQPRLRGFAYRLAGNVHDADDLVQETFVRALPRLDRLDPDTTDIGAYLFATLKNIFLKQVERGKRQQPVAEVPEPVGPTPIDDDPERSTLLRRQQHEVRVANARLDPRQRLVLALRELEDRSYAEIGEIVGLKENAVAQLIFRARESLRIEVRLAQLSPEQFPETCRRFLPLLAAHLDGELKGKRLDETLAHLAGCERCQSALADMREASRRYRTLLLPLGGAEEARAATEEQLELVGYWRRRGRARLGRGTRLGLVAAAAVVLGGGGAALGVGLSQDARRVSAAGTTSTATTAVATTGPPVTTATTAAAPPVTTGAPSATATAVPPPKPQPTPAPRPDPKPAVEPATTEPPVAASPSTTVPAETQQEPPAPATTVKPETATAPEEPAPAPKPTSPPPPPPDTTAPVVTITSAPAANIDVDAALVAFAANEKGATFQCRLDGAAYAGCSSPVFLEALAPGAHAFRVRAVDKAGNVGKPAAVAWTYTVPDTTPPVVTITAAPPASTAETAASFAFSADDAGASFACSLDGAAPSACASPTVYEGLGVGSHTFAVRATDEAGNASADATASWEIVAPAAPPPPTGPPLPDLVVAALTKNAIVVANRGTATAGPSTLTVTLVGTFSVRALEPGESATFTWSTCQAGTYTAVVDRRQAVTESDEGNNTASLQNTCP